MVGNESESNPGTPPGTATAVTVGLAAAAVVVISVVLPWQRHLITGEQVSGFGSGGWIPALAALVAGWQLWSLRREATTGKVSLAAGMAAIATVSCAYLLYYFLTNEEGLLEDVRSATPLAGVYVGLVGSIVLTVATLSLGRTSRSGSGSR